MFCIKCFSKSTSVTNSRPHKRSPSTWRRRKCVTCSYTFTTTESIVLEDYLQIDDKPFSLPRLTVSLTSVLIADETPADSAYWLARTIGEQLLLLEKTSVSRETLLKTVHAVVSRYSPNAGLQYALKYNLIETTATPRRGRPTLRRL